MYEKELRNTLANGLRITPVFGIFLGLSGAFIMVNIATYWPGTTVEEKHYVWSSRHMLIQEILAN